MRALWPLRSGPAPASRASVRRTVARARRVCRAGASLGILEHGVDLRVRKLEVVSDSDRSCQLPVCRKEARARRRWLDADQARDWHAVARDLHLLSGFHAREEL